MDDPTKLARPQNGKKKFPFVPREIVVSDGANLLSLNTYRDVTMNRYPFL